MYKFQGRIWQFYAKFDNKREETAEIHVCRVKAEYADILEAIGDRTVRQAELKRLMRIGMEELARRRNRKMMEKMNQQQ